MSKDMHFMCCFMRNTVFVENQGMLNSAKQGWPFLGNDTSAALPGMGQ